MDISTLLCHSELVLSTCFTNSRPVPSSDRLMATTTMSAIVIVRFRRSPIHTSDKTNCDRMHQSYRIRAASGRQNDTMAVLSTGLARKFAAQRKIRSHFGLFFFRRARMFRQTGDRRAGERGGQARRAGGAGDGPGCGGWPGLRGVAGRGVGGGGASSKGSIVGGWVRLRD